MKTLNWKETEPIIDLIGVENWGKGGFSKYGDLDKALAGTTQIPLRYYYHTTPRIGKRK